MSISQEHINDIPHKIAKAQSPLLMAMCNYIKSQSSEEQQQSRELISLLLEQILARINNPEDIHIQDGITLRIMEVMLAAYFAPETTPKLVGLGEHMLTSGLGGIVVSANNCESKNITESLVNPKLQNLTSEEMWSRDFSSKIQINKDRDFFKNANEITLFFVSPFCANRVVIQSTKTSHPERSIEESKKDNAIEVKKTTLQLEKPKQQKPKQNFHTQEIKCELEKSTIQDETNVHDEYEVIGARSD